MKSGRHCLVVLRDGVLRRLLASALMQRGFTVRAVPEGTLARRDVLANGMPDALIVVLDSGQADLAAGLARDLAGCPEAGRFNVIALVTGVDSLENIEALDSLGTVTPVLVHGLFASVLDAMAEACRQPRPAGDALPSHSPPGANEASADRAIEHALTAVENVTRCVADGSLPGPMIPETLRRARELLAQPRVDFSDLADFAMESQPFAMRLIGMANSAYYWRGRQAKTVIDAITRLGEKKTRLLIHALATRQFIVGKDEALRARVAIELEKAFLVALLAQEIATIETSADPLAVHAIGLFHNIGKVFLYYALGLMSDAPDFSLPQAHALEQVAASRMADLNALVVKPMHLPDEILTLFDPAVPAPRPAATAVLHAAWIAENALNVTKGTVERGPLERFLGLRADSIERLNQALPEILDVARRYRDVS